MAWFSEKKKLLVLKFVLIFTTAFVWKISHSKKNWVRYGQKYVLVFMYSTSQILMTLEFSRQIFEKYAGIKFHENQLSASGIVPCGWKERRTDKHDEANSRFLQFYERT